MSVCVCLCVCVPGQGVQVAVHSAEDAESIAWLGLDLLWFSNSHCRWRKQEGVLVRERETSQNGSGLRYPKFGTRTLRLRHSFPVLHRKIGKGENREQAAHLSPATPSPLASVIYGVIWAASNLIKGHCKLVNRFK